MELMAGCKDIGNCGWKVIRKRAISLLAVALTVLFAQAAGASACPEIELLGTIGGGARFSPLRIALDGKGNAYVTDNLNNALTVYDYNGRQIAKYGIASPLGVAVGAGKLYVGRAEGANGYYTGEVRVYSLDFDLLYSLGSGLWEFSYPIDILADGDRVYVADSRADRIRAYDASTGKLLFSLGENILVRPTSIAVHPVSGELYITDRRLVYDPDSDAMALGAGVNVFTRDGQFVNGFGSYGFEEVPGDISMPTGIAVDAQGRVVVADYSMGYLHVFQDDGLPICIVKYPDYNGSFPQGLNLGVDGRLHIAASGRLIDLGLDDGYTRLGVEPVELTFETQQCNPAGPQSITVSNEGPGALDFTISSSTYWLVPDIAGGVIDGVGSMSIDVAADGAGLPQGTYVGTLSVVAPGAEQDVSVTMTVLPPPALSVSPSALSFYLDDGDAQSQYLEIGLGGAGRWSATTDSAWLGISPSGGEAGTSVFARVSVDASGLAGGTYTGNITVTSDCAAVEPVVVPVTLVYVKGGRIEVITNHDDATFSISGPASYSGSGKSSAFEGVPDGLYTIEFGRVAGFLAPEPYSLEVSGGGTVRFSGIYKDLRKRLNILATPGNASLRFENELRVFDGDGEQKGSIALRDQVSDAYFWRNSIAASGDLDGDGTEEVVVSHDLGVITGFEADGTSMAGLDFKPFEDRAYVDLAVADFDGDGIDEMVVSALNWSENGAAVRVLSYAEGEVVDTGVAFTAYTGGDYLSMKNKNRRGTKVAAGDVDGDGVAEIITVQGGGLSMHNVFARIFKVDASGGMGNWTVTSAGGIRMDDVISYSSDIAAGDVDSDGEDEIIMSIASENTNESQLVRVVALEGDGTVVLDISVPSIMGTEVAAGDLDYDGVAEIVVGSGAFRGGESSWVRVFSAEGSLESEFMAFGSRVRGVIVSVGAISIY